jgi:hypothetical protein
MKVLAIQAKNKTVAVIGGSQRHGAEQKPE